MAEIHPLLSQEQQIEQLTRDNQLLRVKNRSLVQKIHTDTLTQIHNRAFLKERLKVEVQFAINTQLPLAILLVDIDHFHDYNEKYGHPAGDEALKRVARVLRQQSRSSDKSFVARSGGEEFLCLISNADEFAAMKIADRLRIKVQELELDTKARITISIGVAICPDQGTTVDELLVAADRAMYQAKASGRNQVCFAQATSIVPKK